MKEIITTIIIMLFCITALACHGEPEHITMLPGPKFKQIKPGKPRKKITDDSLERSAVKHTAPGEFTQPVSVQLMAGSQGAGADVKYGFLPRLSGRLGFSIIPVDVSRGLGFSSFPVYGQLSSRFSNVHLLADYSPFKSHNFRLVGGAAYLIRGNAYAVITPSNGYTIGSQSLSKDQIGAINADVTWKGVAPYIGFALFKSFPARVFNLNLDVGTYYISSPSTSFTGTKLLSDNSTNARQFNENMQGYRWLPVVQLNFNFRIK